ncbi:MAG: hypothetical protein K8I60_02995 [Anaerolineae bacterium]|nr:hypothetical protein [Anaerolineae bacterium]
MKAKFVLFLFIAAMLVSTGITAAQSNIYPLQDTGIALDLGALWTPFTLDNGFIRLQSENTTFDTYWYTSEYEYQQNLIPGDVTGAMGLLWPSIVQDNTTFNPEGVHSTITDNHVIYYYDYTYTSADGQVYEAALVGLDIADSSLLGHVYPRTGTTLQERDAVLALIDSARLAAPGAGRFVFRLNILDNAAPFEDALTQDVQARLYGFNANQGDLATITMKPTPDSQLDPYLALLGPRGELIAVNDDANYDAGDYSSLINAVSIPETGSYFVIASSYQYITTLASVTGAMPANLDYELTVSGITPVETSGYPLTFYSTEMDAGAPLSGAITPEEPAWYFTFDGHAGDVVNITANGDFDTLIQVFGPEGVRFAVNDDIDTAGGNYNSAVNALALSATGSYLVIVTNPFVFQPSSDTDLQDITLYGAFTAELSK